MRYKTIIINKNSFQAPVNYADVPTTSSAYGVPEDLVPQLNAKLAKVRKMSNYLRYLLNRYRVVGYAGSMPMGNGVKTKYQAKEQNLQYYRFRPRNGDWIELRMLALAHGVSMTQFFVYLLIFDIDKFGSDLDKFYIGIVPTDLLAGKPIRLGIHLLRHKGEKRLRIKFGKSLYIFDNWKRYLTKMYKRTKVIRKTSEGDNQSSSVK